MSVAILYHSHHHFNTKKLAEAVAKEETMDLFNIEHTPCPDLSAYDIIGFATGVYYGKPAEDILNYVKNSLPSRKQVFFLITAGIPSPRYAEELRSYAEYRFCTVLGIFQCKGYDTFGPFRLVGGIAKKHPDETDLQQARAFYRSLPIRKTAGEIL